MFFYNIFKGYTSSIPYLSDALFWLNGEVVGEEFIDKSGNGRNFTITNRDFTADYFPYKTLATISAPIGDAVLIAADINNFLYDSVGDPNEISVTSLFQNIDYADKLFCKHVVQIVNANDIEITEPYVLDIVLYDAALTGDSLSKANTYYGVSTEETTSVQWVAIDGNDTTGDGSKATPWLTLGKAQTEATAGDIIYVKTGQYTETFVVTKDITIRKTGGSFLTDVAGAAALRVNVAGGTHSMGLNGRNVVYAIGVGALSADNLTFDKMSCTKISNTQGIYFYYDNSTLKNSIITGADGNGIYFKSSGGGIIDTNLINSTSVGDGIRVQLTEGTGNIIKNNRFTGTPINAISLDSGNTGDISIIGNLFEVTTTGISSDDPSAITVNIISNIFTQANLTGSHILLNEIFSAINIQKNTVNVTALDVRPSIKTINNSNVDISSNILNFVTVGAIDGLYITSSGTTITDCAISKNRVTVDSELSDILIIIGSNLDDGATGFCDGNIINENRVIGNSYDSAYQHNILYGFSKGIVKHNFSEDGYYGIVNKYDEQDGSDVFGNILLNNIQQLIIKGSDNVKVYNNTIINKNRPTAYGVIVIANSDAGQSGTATEGTIVKNCIIIDETNTGHLLSFSSASDLTSIDIDYNIYYAVKESPFRVDTSYYTFSEWQALGYDTNSVMLTEEQFNALFTDYDNDDYSLAVGSEAIGAGTSLAAAYDDGLDSSTNWGGTEEVPTVVTKQQTGSWDCGAYVS